MTLTLLEGAINALHDYLSGAIVAKVADLNTRYSDEMPDIKAWYKGNMPTAVPEYPSVALVGTGWTPKRQMALALHVENEISLVVFYGDDDLEQRFNRLCRYTIGLIELCNTGATTIGYKVDFRERVALTEVMESQPSLQDVIIPVILDKAEDF